MIRMVSEGGLFCPHVFCDACGERIKDARASHVLWFMEEGGIADEGRIYHTHKRACNAVLEAAARARGLSTAWTPMSAHMMHLACNVEIKTPAEFKSAIGWAKAMAVR